METWVYRIMNQLEWQEARTRPWYAPAELETDGFVHLSCLWQVVEVANFIAPAHADLLLLQIRTAALVSPLRMEDLYGYQEDFPHLYGPLNLDAVGAVHPLCWAKDTFVLPASLQMPGENTPDRPCT